MPQRYDTDVADDLNMGRPAEMLGTSREALEAEIDRLGNCVKHLLRSNVELAEAQDSGDIDPELEDALQVACLTLLQLILLDWSRRPPLVIVMLCFLESLRLLLASHFVWFLAKAHTRSTGTIGEPGRHPEIPAEGASSGTGVEVLCQPSSKRCAATRSGNAGSWRMSAWSSQ